MSDFQPTERTESVGVEVPGESNPAPVRDTPAADTAPRESDSGDDVETRARAMGWRPKDEFRGDPEGWRDADEFVRRGEEELPIARERNRELTRKLNEMEGKLAQVDSAYKNDLSRIERMSAVALTRQRDQLANSYEAALRNAVEMGDTQRYDQLRGDYGQALHQFDTSVREVAQPAPQQPPQPNQRRAMPPQEVAEVSTWQSKNPWFDSDPELNLAAQHHHMRLQREKPSLSLRDNLAETERAVKAQYAERFGMVKTPSPAVEGGSGRLPTSSSRGKGQADLPADARKQGEKYVREGLFKNIGEYASEYFSQDA